VPGPEPSKLENKSPVSQRTNVIFFHDKYVKWQEEAMRHIHINDPDVQIVYITKDKNTHTYKDYVKTVYTSELDADTKTILNLWGNSAILTTSMMRFYYIESYLRLNGIENTFHVESDNSIRGKFSDILPIILRKKWPLAATQLCVGMMTASVMYIRKHSDMRDMIDEAEKWFKLPHEKVFIYDKTKKYPGWASSEMSFLGYYHYNFPEKMFSFPILPFGKYSDLDFPYLFDPATYHQWSRGLKMETHHIVQQALSSGQVKLDKSKWSVSFKGRQFPLFNVHVDNKKLHEKKYLIADSTPKTTIQSNSLGQKETFFYFGVTHPSTIHKAKAMQRTWITKLKSFTWYSTEPDSDLNPHVVPWPGGNEYSKITYRSLLVFKHVWENYPGYDWYVRQFDDTYVFPERLEKLVTNMDPNKGIVVGRNCWLGNIRFVCGGPPWVISRGALDAWFKGNENPDTMLQKKWGVAEDVYISDAMYKTGKVTFYHSTGFHAQSLKHPEVALTAREVIQGKMAAEDRKWKRCQWKPCVNTPNDLGVIALHYVPVKDAELIWKEELLTMPGHSIQKSFTSNPSWPKRPTKTYYSSKWEQLWLDNIEQWQDHQICEALDEQKEQIHTFIKDTCSATTDTDWCLIDDSVHQVWYNTKDGQATLQKPSSVNVVHAVTPINYEHIVYVGGSISRYRYLDLVYQEHFSNRMTPELLINEKQHKTWAQFYKYSTELFEGAMECDCFRSQQWNIDTLCENRYYKSPKNPKWLTYIQWFHNSHGHTTPIFNENVKLDWKYNIFDTVRKKIMLMNPKPTHIVFNNGIWEYSFDIKLLFQIVRDLGAIPMWAETSNSPNSPHLTDNDRKAHELLGDDYIPFKIKTIPTDFWDTVHFSNALIYRKWNKNILERIHQQRTKIWSYFELPDGTREYIEPLVSHLRHPLARCLFGDTFLIDRSYVLPGNPGSSKTFLFDAGASHWSQGAGGPSLSYFTSVWKRYGFDWSHIEGWEGGTTVAKFEATVPQEWRSRTHFHQDWISTSPDKQPFVPDVIRSTASKEDYVVFKLDIDSKAVETAIVDYLLTHTEALEYIDEFVWEQHVDNYIMAPAWAHTQDMSKSIADSYQYFLKLRKLGVRAHSWV
jgi:hypothetical protein